jgi:hypothetical protein
MSSYKLLLMHHIVTGIVGTLAPIRQIKFSIPLAWICEVKISSPLVWR